MGLWFSVYEEILNDPKVRHAAKDLGTSECEIVGSLTFLWGWALHNADSKGRVLHADLNDIADILRVRIRRDNGPTPEDVVQTLIKAGFIDEIDGLYYIHNWDERQKYYFRYESKKEKDRERQKRVEKPSEKPKTESKPGIKEYTGEFESFWKAYPKHVGKGECYKKYKARLNDGFSPQELLVAAKNYAAECKRKNTEMTYIKHGKTFLSDAMPFTDYLPKKQDVKVDDGDPFADWR